MEYQIIDTMNEMMIYKQNPLTNDWLCYIPDTPYAWYCPTLKSAKMFCEDVNAAFASGKLSFDDDGKLITN